LAHSILIAIRHVDEMGHNVVRRDVSVSAGHLTGTAVLVHTSFILVRPG